MTGEPGGRRPVLPPGEEIPGMVREAIGEGATLLSWATGGAAVTACLDLLVAVLMGLEERPLYTDLVLPLAAVAFLGFPVAALAWRRARRDLPVVVGFHALAAGAGWWWLGKAFGDRVPFVLLAALGAHALFAAAALAGWLVERGVREERAEGRTAAAAGAVAENLESVLVAIVFALVIRHFAVEAYKIPTASMEPTLLGDHGKRGPGDRVLVKKWDALLGGPERFEVWVFRPPLDRTINYVKRVAGLPGETVEIEDGDLYVDGAIARKPPRTREDMWFPVYPDPWGERGAAPPWAGEGFRREGEDGFRVSGAAERRLLRFDRPVRDAVTGRSGANAVGDVRVRFSVEEVEPGTEFVVRILGRAGPVEAVVPADGRQVRVTLGATVAEVGVPAPEPVRDLEVSFADLQVEVKVNGKVRFSGDADPVPRRERPSYGVSFGVEKGGAVFRVVRLDRDVFYTGSHRFEVPEGHYLFLGDNSSNSQDSREWRALRVVEKGAEGRTFLVDPRHGPRAVDSPGRMQFLDRNGVFRSYDPGEIEVSGGTEPIPFVPRADLHGRAFCIFWPPRGFTTVDGGRVRFLP